MAAEKPISEWNTKDFHNYMIAEHMRLFGVPYVPFRSWRAEQGLLGNIIGTKTKPGSYDKDLIKAFIDKCFATYRPTRDYPGISFGFIWAYKRNYLQQVIKEQPTKDIPAKDENINSDWW